MSHAGGDHCSEGASRNLWRPLTEVGDIEGKGKQALYVVRVNLR
jgi:hypothetical protein